MLRMYLISIQRGGKRRECFPLQQPFTLSPSIGCKWMFAGVVTHDPFCPPCFLNQMLLLWTMATAT